jgi:ESS family glutamate:Na+ symporter
MPMTWITIESGLAVSVMSMWLWTSAGLADCLFMMFLAQARAEMQFILIVLFPALRKYYQVLSPGTGLGRSLHASPEQ